MKNNRPCKEARRLTAVENAARAKADRDARPSDVAYMTGFVAGGPSGVRLANPGPEAATEGRAASYALWIARRDKTLPADRLSAYCVTYDYAADDSRRIRRIDFGRDCSPSYGRLARMKILFSVDIPHWDAVMPPVTLPDDAELAT